jgi:hypothetical protein
MQPLLAAATAAALLGLAHGPASAVALVGLTSANQISVFDSANPAGASTVAITGLAGGDRFIGIDLRPSNNLVYGVTLSNQLYTVDPLTGAASFVASLSLPVISASLGYGIDFNPVADFNGASSLRLVSSAGDNFAINANTGVVGNAANTIGTGYTAVAYSNSTPLPSAAPPSTQLYYIDSATDTLAMAPGAFNTPTIGTVGALGIDVLRANGFELLANGQAFAALNVDGSSLDTGLYSIDLGNGSATLLGAYNGTLSGLTLAPVPEPSAYLQMLAGLAAMGGIVRLRRRRA